MSEDNISVESLAKAIAEKQDFFLLDVRNLDEYQSYNLGGHLIPLPELAMRLAEVPQDLPIVVYCHSGYRSQIAQSLLQQNGFSAVKNLTGGVLAWKHKVI